MCSTKEAFTRRYIILWLLLKTRGPSGNHGNVQPSSRGPAAGDTGDRQPQKPPSGTTTVFTPRPHFLGLLLANDWHGRVPGLAHSCGCGTPLPGDFGSRTPQQPDWNFSSWSSFLDPLLSMVPKQPCCLHSLVWPLWPALQIHSAQAWELLLWILISWISIPHRPGKKFTAGSFQTSHGCKGELQVRCSPPGHRDQLQRWPRPKRPRKLQPREGHGCAQCGLG